MMTLLRSRAATATLVALLACQLAGVPAASFGWLGVSGVDATAMTRCTCAHSPHANCPMHHPAKNGRSPSGAHWCAGTFGGTALVIATAIYTPGVLPVSTHLPAPAAQRQPLADLTPALPSLFGPPPSPPPRA